MRERGHRRASPPEGQRPGMLPQHRRRQARRRAQRVRLLWPASWSCPSVNGLIVVARTMLCAEPSSSPVFEQRYLVTEEAPPAAIAGVHERTAVIDRVRALALIVVYNSMAHKALASYAPPARESANIRTAVPARTRVIASNAPMRPSPAHLTGWNAPCPGRTAKLIESRRRG